MHRLTKSLNAVLIISFMVASCELYRLKRDSTHIPEKIQQDSEVLFSKTIGIADTTIASVSGHIFFLSDKKGNVQDTVKYAAIYFNNSDTPPHHGTNSKKEGEYQIHLKPGKYTVKCSYLRCHTLVIKEFSLRAGEMRQLDIGLGCGYPKDSTIYTMVSDTEFVKQPN
jgi:hypothetical protein